MHQDIFAFFNLKTYQLEGNSVSSYFPILINRNFKEKSTMNIYLLTLDIK
jgi:hypothetical protein